MCLYLRSEKQLGRNAICIEVDGYGVPALMLTSDGGGGWQANAKLPPGLDAGMHEVRIRTANSRFSQSFPISVGDSVARTAAAGQEGDGPAPIWIAAENTLDKSNVFRGYKAEYLSCRFLSNEAGLQTADVVLELDGETRPILVLASLGNREWQINATVPDAWSPGRHQVRVRTIRSRFSVSAEIFYEPAKVIKP